MKEIKEELYQMKIGSEVYSVRYPSLAEAEMIQSELVELQEKNGNIIEYIKNKLVELDLNPKFFSLKQVKARDLYETWNEVNSIKK